MFNTAQGLKVFVIPGWVYRCINRNKLNIVDIYNYAKMRKILSIDDLAEWEYLNYQFKLNGCHLSNIFLDSIFENLTQEERTEFKNSVQPLSGTENIAQAVTAKLNTYGVDNSTFYDFIVSNNTICIIINEGFLTHISKTNEELDFIKNYLKQCYSMAPLADVSKLEIFKLYINHLQ